MHRSVGNARLLWEIVHYLYDIIHLHSHVCSTAHTDRKRHELLFAEVVLSSHSLTTDLPHRGDTVK